MPSLPTDLCGGGAHFIKNSRYTFNLTFSQPMTQTLSVFILQVNDDLITINKENQVASQTGVM